MAVGIDEHAPRVRVRVREAVVERLMEKRFQQPTRELVAGERVTHGGVTIQGLQEGTGKVTDPYGHVDRAPRGQ